MYKVYNTGLFSEENFNVVNFASTMRNTKMIGFSGIESGILKHSFFMTPTYLTVVDYSTVVFRNYDNEIMLGIGYFGEKSPMNESSFKRHLIRWIRRAADALLKDVSSVDEEFYLIPANREFMACGTPGDGKYPYLQGSWREWMFYEKVDVFDTEKKWLKKLSVSSFITTIGHLLNGCEDERLSPIAAEAVKVMAEMAMEKVREYGDTVKPGTWFGHVRDVITHAAMDENVTKECFYRSVDTAIRMRSSVLIAQEDLCIPPLADIAFSLVEVMRKIKKIAPNFTMHSLLGVNYDVVNLFT